MAAYRCILVPTDFSPTAAIALQHAADLARTFGAELIVLHVLPTTTWPIQLFHVAGNVLPNLPEEVRNGARQQLAEARAKLDDKLAVQTELREGDVWSEILAAAGQHRADLIVIGTHGSTGVKHLLLGSVAEKVVRSSPVPVLTVRGA